MAAGDLTRDTGMPVAIAGGLMVLTGTVQLDDTYRGFALLPSTSYIMSCHLQDSSGAGRAEVDINTNAAGSTVNGTIGATGNHRTTNTYRYHCLYRGA